MGKNSFAEIQYMGEPGITQTCLDAVIRLIQYHDHIKEVKILSNSNRHCLLITIQPHDVIAIKSGFGTGYTGEGSRKFSYLIELLNAHGIEIDEYDVPNSIIDKLDQSALTNSDIDLIKSTKPVRPQRFWEYIWSQHLDDSKEGVLWKDFRPVIPFAIIDPRIIDLAISFWKHPDANLNDGYRRFEDTVRARTELEDYGYDLFKKAFLQEDSVLKWKNIANGEKVARANLISSAYSAYRNPRAHKEKKNNSHEYLSEFLFLNHLFLLENEAVGNSTSQESK